MWFMTYMYVHIYVSHKLEVLVAHPVTKVSTDIWLVPGKVVIHNDFQTNG